MKIWGAKNLIAIMVAIVLCLPVCAESLFYAGISESQTYSSIQPRSLYNSGVATQVGDIVTIVMDETINTSDVMKYKLERNSTLTDRFSPLFNQALPEGWKIPEQLNGFGGGQNINNTVDRNRIVKYKDRISAQVTQVLPNGNLLVQGKKITVSNGERVSLIVSGVIDPRHITRRGLVESSKVANLQFGFVGDGTVSRSDNEGLVNKFVRFLF